MKEENPQICTINNVTDITDQGNPISGTFAFTFSEDSPKFHWSPGSKCILNLKTSSYNPGSPFSLDYTQITSITLSESPLTLNLHFLSNPTNRIFTLNQSSYKSFSELISTITLNGLFLPIFNEGHFILLNVCRNTGLFPITPIDFTDLKDLFNKILSIYNGFILGNTDPDLPFTKDAISFNSLFFSLFPFKPVGEPLTRIDIEDFREQAFLNGIDESLLPNAFPFILGITKESEPSLREEYTNLQAKLASYQNDDDNMNCSFHCIVLDSQRIYFKTTAFTPGGQGRAALIEVMQCMILSKKFDMYLSGMVHTLAHIIKALAPEWDSSGAPVGVDIEDIKWLAFWCYLKLTDTLDHWKIMKDKTFMRILSDVMDIIKRTIPVVWAWLMRCVDGELLFAVSDVFVFFANREDAIKIWINALCSKEPSKWLKYFVAALIVYNFEKIAVKDNPDKSEVYVGYNKIDPTHDLGRIGQLAEFMYTNDKHE